MPADTCFVTARIRDHKICLALDQIGRQCCGSLSQSLVGLLKSDDISIKVCDDTCNTMWVAPPIKSDAFTDIPCCKSKVRHIQYMA